MMWEYCTSLSRWASLIDRYSQIFINRNFREEGIGPGQLHFLLHLHSKEGITQDQISKELSFDRASTTRALQVLEDARMITRVADEMDRRRNFVYLTDKGRDVTKVIITKMTEWTNLLTKGMSKEETDMLFGLLQKTANNALDYVDGKMEEHSD